ncbi:gamma-glutamyltransferase family protein [Wenxinia saemankumensis]|uniref:Gamma-glutamyltransferase 2. Threonine peptidase. MEROPS family T03 n=1 Tax=Wenxinia saemankumensis TaxID=1447782 RepID=A0A1M6DSC9_9RHOB|nr:gamma-glutamyltransferase family protein [Wenxinia saemankumensis]SHI76085.1 gamma-glutamyltransferase 2. Threonine peptidase. MEROPS family T03 [Wenxinia saemankumensis]
MRDFHLPGRSTIHAVNGMCATSHPIAARVAVSVMEAGGNAVDAAIAGAATLSICEPPMCGLGGDMFALVAEPGQDVVALNGSGRAPDGFDAGRLRAEGHATIPLDGAHAVTMPGAVDGFCALAERYGSWGLDRILAPAIRYAEEGVPVAPRTAFDWAMDAHRLSGAARRHWLANDAAPAAGTLFRAPGIAEVLRRIATDGRAGFYEGEVAADMAATLAALGGSHVEEDFAAVAHDWATPISTGWGGMEVLEHPPNGQGATALLLLEILKQLGIEGLDPLGAERAHLEAEASKLAYEARDRYVSDPDHGGVERMLDPALAERLAGLIDPERARPATRPEVGAAHKDTVYLCTVDSAGRAVSLIYSVFHGFGAGIASEKFGIMFQNRGAGFTLAEGHPNEGAPGKRPLHTIIPGMLRRDGRVLGPFGVMGGAYQPCGHARFVANLETYGMDVQEAIDAPRCFAGPQGLAVERGYRPEVRDRLAAMGHEVHTPETPIGGAQAILIGADGGLTGGSDPRKDGCALGF